MENNLDRRFVRFTDYRMPEPGFNFINHAAQIYPSADYAKVDVVKTGSLKHVVSVGAGVNFLYNNALYTPHYTIPVAVRGNSVEAKMLPGHFYSKQTGIHGFYGPVMPAKVMVVTKQPSFTELAEGRYLSDDVRKFLAEIFTEYGFTQEEVDRFYVTGLVKWAAIDPKSSVLPKAWQKDCLPLLENEIRLVKPDIIICFGSDPAKALLGTAAGVKQMIGNVLPYRIYNVGATDADSYSKEAQIIAAISPLAVLRKPEEHDTFSKQIDLFSKLYRDKYEHEESFIDHRVISDLDTLKTYIDEVRADPNPGRQFIAIDAEWHGDHPSEENAYVRSIQFSTKHGEGITVELYGAGKETEFIPDVQSAISQLKRLFYPDPDNDWNPRIGGHFLRADTPWLVSLGLDRIPELYAVAPFAKCRTSGGWDTSLMHHAVNEIGPFKLEEIAAKLLGIPRYDNELQRWKKRYCLDNNIKDKDLDGYGMCPSEILYPYGCYDADVTRRLAVLHMKKGGLLDKGTKGENSWTPYWIAHRASAGFLEMETTGLVLDLDRVDELSELYESQYQRLLAEFVIEIGWDNFNPNSVQQCSALLFGEKFNYKTDKNGDRICIAPKSAKLQDLAPLKATGKPAMTWENVIRDGKESVMSPSTDSHVLGILAQTNEIASKLMDLKIISKVLSGPIRKPIRQSGKRIKDENGNYKYSDGLYVARRADGKVHTTLFQTKETGRASSARPPLQNITKKREADYRRILGDAYKAPIRSVLKASPGCLLVEADYTGAELAAMAWVSGDENMIEQVRRNGLPEDHPDYYDIHSNTAVRAFNLKCEPTKAGLKSIDKSALRISAKAIAFGIPYGRGVKAIQQQCKEEGVDITVDDAKKLVETYFSQYPKTKEYMELCEERVRDGLYLVNAFGRYRRFRQTDSEEAMAEQIRQGWNFAIQSTVADAVNCAIYNFLEYRKETGLEYRLALQVHDELILEVPYKNVERMVKEVMTECMVNRVPVFPRKVDGTKIPVSEPYHFSIEIGVNTHWGEKASKEYLSGLGINI